MENHAVLLYNCFYFRVLSVSPDAAFFTVYHQTPFKTKMPFFIQKATSFRPSLLVCITQKQVHNGIKIGRMVNSPRQLSSREAFCRDVLLTEI